MPVVSWESMNRLTHNQSYIAGTLCNRKSMVRRNKGARVWGKCARASGKWSLWHARITLLRVFDRDIYRYEYISYPRKFKQ